ncbi:DUF4290 domain-containing protein [Salinivirga cyanobacteriivorans]|uniref:DUF4290 domain-containing protein n=1 Tax=Salinivirga cyanobacteriivorans TaxID=1307839 RepID=A0A0S2I449_9BACT|nr:DUF4290 domain-containing protein [Salinivirga cyanobacteriivorans]ALO16941.1 hypothetical protein L21SP5_03328 [Salinivirga cyanobacteriivorans]
MEYNTTRNELILPEYGRHIQKLVQHIKTIEDREERTKAAHALIPIMAQVNTNLRENGDYKHKLWDHLFIMADFDLDVDAPFEMPDKEVLNRKPDPLPYSQGKFKKKHYGKIIQNMMDKIDDYSPEEQEVLVELLANQLKKSYVKWNKESVNDDVIISDFIELAEKDVNFKDNIKLVETRNILAKPKKKKTNRKNRN